MQIGRLPNNFFQGRKPLLFGKVGVLHCVRDKVCPGFTLVPTFRGRNVHLIDIDGNEVHRWNLPGRLGSLAYLLPNGNLFAPQ